MHCQNRDIDLPTSTNISYPPRTSSCTSTTRPTSATRNTRPATPIYDSINISYMKQSSSCTSTTRPTSATRNDRPAAHIYDSTNISYPRRSSSCTHLQLDQHQLPTTIHQLHTSTTRPTSATRNDRLAAHIYNSTIPATDITHLAEDTNTTTTNFTHAFVNTIINCHPCYIIVTSWNPYKTGSIKLLKNTATKRRKLFEPKFFNLWWNSNGLLLLPTLRVTFNLFLSLATILFLHH